MTIELTREECQELAKLLETALDEIGPEIRHTSTRDYREELKAERLVLRGLYDRLFAASVQN